MKALLILDLQNDLLPEGVVPIPNAETVIPLANQLQGDFKLIVATQKWHPANHCSFAANHRGRTPGETIKLRRGPQRLSVVNCVQKTRGAEITTGLSFNRVNRVFKRGTDADIDGYSAFFDNDHHATGLGEFLKAKKVTEVFILGLATEYCVKHTALDAIALGFKAYVYEDACRGINLQPDDVKDALTEMQAAGVQLIQSNTTIHRTKKRHLAPV